MMKKMLSYVGLLLLAGVIFGAIVTGLVWMQHLYDLSVSYYLFTAAFWLGMAATVLFGIWLRRYYPQLSKNWVFFAVLTALFGVYLFPIFLAPTCSEIPTVKAGCETTCVQVCIHYHEAGTGGCPEIPDLPNPDWDVGCCFDYAPSCTTVCTNDPPSVTGHTECDVFGNDGWCVEGGELYMSGSDPDGDHITISGTMVGQSFSCPQGTSCVRTLYEGSGNAVFHSYDGELSSGNFSIAYKYDATPPTLTPTVTGTAGTNSWYISPISVATGATDPASGVMISKIRLFTGDWQDSLDFDVDGIYYVEMSALDNAGNESVQQAQIMLDTTNPVYDVVVSGTAGVSDWYRSDVNWQASATDATSGMASIEVIMDASAWNIGDTAAFSAEGPHTVDFRFTDIAGNSVETNHTFSIDKTAPTIVIDNPTEGKVVNRTVMVSGNAADNLSGLVEVAVSPDGGATWHMIPWETDGSWIYDWDTTQGPNGVFALIARTTDVAGNVTTDQVNVIVDNAPPTVTLTESWEIWETARAAVFSNIIPIGSISITVDCDEQPDRVIEYNANEGAFDFKWDHRCGDGNLAPSGSYTVVLEACDIYHNCDDARGTVDIPFVALQIAPPTATPMPTAEKTEAVKQWYTNPTAIPSNTPTPKAEQNLPVLPLTGGNDSGDSNTPSGNNQPLLPLAAAALGTSVLLAASSRKEEETANETKISEIPYVKVTSLSTLAGVVKETFEGVWEDAIRISAADPRRVTVYKTGIDLDEYNRKLASWVAEIEYKQTDEYKRTVASYQEEMTISAKVHEKILGNESVNYDDYAEYMRLISSTGGRALTDLTNQQLIDFALPDDIPNEAAIKAIRTYLTTKEVAEERAKADAIAAATATALNKKMERDEIKITQNIGPKTKEEKKIWDKFIRDESLTSEQNNVQKTETEQKKTLWGIISGIWSGASSSAIEAVRSSTPTLSPTITPTNTPSSTPTVTFTPTVTNTPTVTPTVTRVAEIKTPYPGKYEITYFTELPFKYPGGSLASYLAGSTDGTRGVACYYGPGPNDTYWAEVTAKANLKNTGGYHSGIDFSLPLGTPLYWTGDQDAIWVGQDLRFGAGPTNFVVKTENEFALYGHSIPLTNKDLQIEYRCRDGSILGIDDNCNINPNIPNSRNPELTYIGDEEYYSDGTVIHPGDLIGYSGENDAGVAHLHWEIRPIIDGKSLTTGCYINPLSRFDPKLFNDWYDLIKEDYFDPNTPLDGYYEVYDNCPEVEE